MRRVDPKIQDVLRLAGPSRECEGRSWRPVVASASRRVDPKSCDHLLLLGLREKPGHLCCSRRRFVTTPCRPKKESDVRCFTVPAVKDLSALHDGAVSRARSRWQPVVNCVVAWNSSATGPLGSFDVGCPNVAVARKGRNSRGQRFSSLASVKVTWELG